MNSFLWGAGDIVQISVSERALGACWGWSTASQRETVPFTTNLHSSPSSAPGGLRTLQDLAGILVSLLRLPQSQDGIASHVWSHFLPREPAAE